MRPQPTARLKRTRLGRFVAVCATAAGLVLALPQPGAAQRTGQNVVWGQEVFVIPYRWSGGSNKSAVSEVVLYLSQDQGASWSEVTRARPDVQSFMYRAPRDGDYWFAIRTIDSTGGSWPPGPLQSELRVTVDTRLPTVTIRSATLGADGRVTVEAEASDPQLDPSSIAVAVLDPMTSQWVNLRANVSSTGADTAAVSATGNLSPGVSRVMVRVTAKDRAGNSGTAGHAATASAPLGDRRAGVPARQVAVAPPDPFTRSTAFQPQPPSSPASPWPAPPAAASARPAWQTAGGAPTQVWRPDNQALPTVGTTGAAPPTSVVNQDVSTYRFASNAASNLPRTQLERPPEQKLLVNSNRFELQYNLHTMGPWGVSKVEVWGSEDLGQTWRVVAVDTDQRSPVDVQVAGDGVYGFKILVQSVGGLEQNPPRAGERPDVLVEVDSTRPAASLVSAAQPDGYFADHLVFTWNVQDANLAERPVSLLYAAKPSGPWQPIASNLENTGRYSWRLQRHLPTEVFLRLEARDRAGNVGVDQSPQSVAIRLPESTGQILQVRPLE